MAKGLYTVVNNTTHKIKRLYTPVNGTTHKIKKAFSVIGGVVHPIFMGGELVYKGKSNTSQYGGWYNISHGYNSVYGFLGCRDLGTSGQTHIRAINKSLTFTVPPDPLRYSGAGVATHSFNDHLMWSEGGKTAYRTNTSLTTTAMSNVVAYGMSSSCKSTSTPNNWIIGAEGWVSPDWHSRINAFNKQFTKLSAYGTTNAYGYAVGKTANKAWFLGGYHDTTGSSASVQIFDDSLTQTSTTLSTSKREMLDGWTNKYTFIAGGYHYTGTNTGEYTKSIDAFNDSGTRTTLTWGTYADYAPRNGYTLMESCGENHMIIFGGVENSDMSSLSSRRMRNTATTIDESLTKHSQSLDAYLMGGGATRVAEHTIFFPQYRSDTAYYSTDTRNYNYYHFVEE